MYGRNLSDETKEKISLANKGKIVVKDAISNETIGLIYINHEKIVSGEWVSINTGKTASKEKKEKVSKIRKESGIIPPSCDGTVYWNNGIISTRSENCPGEGWVRGRIPFKHKNKKKGRIQTEEEKLKRKETMKERNLKPPSTQGKFLWNNGESQKFSHECPGEGWVKGKLFKKVSD